MKQNRMSGTASVTVYLNTKFSRKGISISHIMMTLSAWVTQEPVFRVCRLLLDVITFYITFLFQVRDEGLT